MKGCYRISWQAFLHRFGASLNPHFHYHLCVLDGVFEQVEDREREDSSSTGVRFHEATALTRADVEALRETVRCRVLRWFHRHGRLEEHTAREMLAWEHAGGFSLDASIRIEAHDRAGLTFGRAGWVHDSLPLPPQRRRRLP